MYCVTCKNGVFTFEQRQRLENLTIGEDLNNRFPFTLPSPYSDFQVFIKGSYKQCQDYLADIDISIKPFFEIVEVDDEAKKLI